MRYPAHRISWLAQTRQLYTRTGMGLKGYENQADLQAVIILTSDWRGRSFLRGEGGPALAE